MRVLLTLLLTTVVLAGCLSDDGPDTTPGDVPAALSFLAPVDLVCPDYIVYAQGQCAQFGEPQLEVAGDGTIWYSAVCCVGQSPPIWRSFDGGLTFEAMDFGNTDNLGRDVFGIEGDFAIDEAGNVYFFDISAATAYLTKYTADGTNVHTKPDPFPPLVDRPWVRAGAEDEVFIAYNTGSTERFYRSTDGGLTWDLPGSTEFPCGLAGLGQGGDRDHLTVSACGMLWQSWDGGLTWDAGTAIPHEGALADMGPAAPAYADDAETTYVPQLVSTDDENSFLTITAVSADGTVGDAVTIGGKDGVVAYAWTTAGKAGQAAIVYYASDDATMDDQQDADWYLRVAYSTDADSADPTWTVVDADPEPVHQGVLGRSLGDLLEIRNAENGDLVIAYATTQVGSTTTVRFVRSTGLDLGHAEFLNGPQP